MWPTVSLSEGKDVTMLLVDIADQIGTITLDRDDKSEVRWSVPDVPSFYKAWLDITHLEGKQIKDDVIKTNYKAWQRAQQQWDTEKKAWDTEAPTRLSPLRGLLSGRWNSALDPGSLHAKHFARDRLATYYLYCGRLQG